MFDNKPFFAFMLDDCLQSLGIGIHLKGLILAQNERWRRGLGMQVEREASLRGGGQRQTA
jgi:hypothetical protein